jgi:hypothetical protein
MVLKWIKEGVHPYMGSTMYRIVHCTLTDTEKDPLSEKT